MLVLLVLAVIAVGLMAGVTLAVPSTKQERAPGESAVTAAAVVVAVIAVVIALVLFGFLLFV